VNCPRCSGLMVPERFHDEHSSPSFTYGDQCVNCAYVDWGGYRPPVLVVLRAHRKPVLTGVKGGQL